MVLAGTSFALESTLSGKTHLALLRAARQRGYRIILQFILLDSPGQAVERVSLRVLQGGHDVPEGDIRRRFERGRWHLVDDYLPLADEWALWDNTSPPPRCMAGSSTHRVEEISDMLNSSKTQETVPYEISELERLGLEAGRIATAKMLEHYRRQGIEVTPQMTLAKPVRKAENGAEG